MDVSIEKLAYQIMEGFQSSSLSSTPPDMNIFNQPITIYESSDLSFITAMITTGSRGTAIVEGSILRQNLDLLTEAIRRHVPLVVHTHVSSGCFEQINTMMGSGCFQFIANSPEERIHLALIAQRITELSLIPGIVIADYQPGEDEMRMPDSNLIQDYLGRPDDQITCPTPAQEIIFGKTRRRIPKWFSFEMPVLIGSRKDDRALAFEKAGLQKYFYDHLPELIDMAFNEYQELTGFSFHPIVRHGSSKDFSIITIGSSASGHFDEKNSDLKRVELIHVNQLFPFPYTTLSKLIKNKKSITILEDGAGHVHLNTPFHSQVSMSLKGSGIRIYHGRFVSGITGTALQKVMLHMQSGKTEMDYYVDIPFTKDTSDFPKHQILLQDIKVKYPDIQKSSILSQSKKKPDPQSALIEEIPLIIRKYHNQGPVYAQLAQFYNNTAFFYEHLLEDELVADPMSATSVLPPSSASFLSESSKRSQIPIFDPVGCTGCGDCFTFCPHAALPPIAIDVEELLKKGAKLASSKGEQITRLMPLIKNLSKVAANFTIDQEINRPLDFLPKAFNHLVTEMKMDGEKLEVAKRDFDRVMDEIGIFSVAVTDTFYNAPSSIEKGSGLLFSVSINPMSCDGCAICADICPEQAILMQKQDDQNLDQARRQFALWEQLPDTSGYTISRYHLDENYPSLAAILLSRNYYNTLGGAGSDKQNLASKTLIHITTAVAESVIQPKRLTQLEHISSQIQELSENIHQKLSSNLPKDDFEALSESLHKTQSKGVFLEDVIHQIDPENHGGLLDAEELERKTDLVQELKHLKWNIEEGPTGLGKSRYGLLLGRSKSFHWATSNVANHFSSPSIVQWNGSQPDQTLGLIRGTRQAFMNEVIIMRKARLEVKDQFDVNSSREGVYQLKWNELTEEEKGYASPLFLFVDNEDIKYADWGKLQRLLSEQYPIKVFLLNDISPSDLTASEDLAEFQAGLISTMAMKNAFVFQGGMGDSDHLFKGLVEGIDKHYPAFFNLHVFEQENHNSKKLSWSNYASLAVNSRAFPMLLYDPVAETSFLHGGIRIDDNPGYQDNWVSEEIEIAEEETLKYQITWADWAFTQKKWKSHFHNIKAGSDVLMIADYLALDKNARKEKTPAIVRESGSNLTYFQASGQVITITELILKNWNTLQELSGIRTEFPSKLKAILTKEISEEFAKKEEDLRTEYEQKLREIEINQGEILRQQLKKKLVALSHIARSKKTEQ